MAEGTNTKETRKIGRPRPLSPHLQVYKPQFTSMLSILHRASIISLYFGVLGFIYFLYIQAFNYQCPVVNAFQSSALGVIIGKLIFSYFALAASYWVCATIRHLVWDLGRGYEIHTAYKTAWITGAATLILTIAIIYFTNIW